MRYDTLEMYYQYIKETIQQTAEALAEVDSEQEKYRQNQIGSTTENIKQQKIVAVKF